MNNKLAFIDIETTSLDERTGSILEVGIVIADNSLRPVGRFSTIVKHDGTIADSVVETMHTSSGLLTECRSIGVSMSEAEVRACSFMDAHFSVIRPPMCGSSVQFDQRWLKRKMPRLASCFHEYRVIDVRSIERFARVMFPAWEPRTMPRHLHRAIPDIEDCIEQTREIFSSLMHSPSLVAQAHG